MNKNLKIGVWLVFLLVAGMMALPCSLQAEEEVERLKKQVEELKNRVAELEAEKAAAQAAQGPVSPYDRLKHSRDPFAEMEKLRREMDKVFEETLRGAPAFPALPSGGIQVFGDATVDLKETPEGYEAVVDLRGLNKDKVDVEINEHSLSVSGEYSSQEEEKSPDGHYSSRSFGKFHKTIPLPLDADTKAVKTSQEGETLVIRIPKKK